MGAGTYLSLSERGRGWGGGGRLFKYLVACEKKKKIRHFATPPLVSASADLNFHTDDSTSDCLKIYFNQPETLPMPDPGKVASSEEIPGLVPRSSFRRETRGGVTKCRLFSQAKTSIIFRLRL